MDKFRPMPNPRWQIFCSLRNCTDDSKVIDQWYWFDTDLYLLNLLLSDQGITSYAVHPGTVSSEISTHIENWFPSWWNATVGQFVKSVFLKTSENGAQTSVYCAVAPGIESLSGSYFA